MIIKDTTEKIAVPRSKLKTYSQSVSAEFVFRGLGINYSQSCAERRALLRIAATACLRGEVFHFGALN